MARLIFLVLNTSSHYNASYKFARKLQESGHTIIYADNAEMEEKVRKEGFDFYERVPLFQKVLKNVDAYKTSLNDVQWSKPYIFLYRYFYKKNFIQGDFLDKMLKDCKPDMVYLDISLKSFFPILEKNDIPYMILSTKVCHDKFTNIPPYNSAYIPQNTIGSKIKVELIWQKVLWKRSIKNMCSRLFFPLFPINFNELGRSLAKELGVSFKEVIKNLRPDHYGLKHVYEIILSPKEFDFPRATDEKQLYVGPIADINRIEPGLDEDSERKILHAIRKKGTKKLLLCTLGSYDSTHKQKRIDFLIKLTEAFASHTDYCVLVSTVKDVDIQQLSLGELPSNIHFFPWLPQLRLLRYADLMITHGGMQTITECILLEVPVLVYPLNLDLDQPGNAARVVYHKIGLQGNMNTVKPQKILKQAKTIVEDPTFKNNIEEMSQKYKACKDFDRGCDFINREIQRLCFKDSKQIIQRSF